MWVDINKHSNNDSVVHNINCYIHTFYCARCGRPSAVSVRHRCASAARADAAVQETAPTGNTILFVQPTSDAPSLERPPPTDTLVDSSTVIFTRSVHDLSKAELSTARREVHMRIVRERKD